MLERRGTCIFHRPHVTVSLTLSEGGCEEGWRSLHRAVVTSEVGFCKWLIPVQNGGTRRKSTQKVWQTRGQGGRKGLSSLICGGQGYAQGRKEASMQCSTSDGLSGPSGMWGTSSDLHKTFHLLEDSLGRRVVQLVWGWEIRFYDVPIIWSFLLLRKA